MKIKNILIAVLLFVVSFGLIFFVIKLFVPIKYQAEMVIYPPNTHINEHLIEAGLQFGGEKEINEYIEILNSLDVRDSLINQHKLRAHYQLPNLKENNAAAINEFNKNLNIERSLNKSIHIYVMDKDPEIAVQLALSLVEIADDHKSRLIKNNLIGPYTNAKKAYEDKKIQVSENESLLNKMRENGEYYWTNGEEKKSIQYELQNMKYISEFEQLNQLKSNFEKLKINLEQRAPKSYIISKPSKDAVKNYPNPTKISGVMALLFSLIYLSIIVIKEKVIFE